MLWAGVRAMVGSGGPVSVRLRADGDLLRFLKGAPAYCTTRAWRRSMDLYRPLNERIFGAFDAQFEGGAGPPTQATEILAGFVDAHEASHLLHDLHGLAASGQRVGLEMVSGDIARELEPALSNRVGFAVRIPGQRYITPHTYVKDLAERVRRQGSEILAQHPVSSVERRGGRVAVHSESSESLEADAVILACGAWLAALARPHGVKVPVQAGRGYSFTVPLSQPLRAPLYLSAARVAIAPDGARARVTGLMDIEPPDAPMGKSRIDSIIQSAAPLVSGFDWDRRSEGWVGPRPLTTDGRPLIGASNTEGVYVAGGHGMWGVTLGPLTGELLAQQILTGVTPPELLGMEPCR
jgi:D-amino-acid dehydrogenase